MVHELKTWKAYFQLMVDGIKPFELRNNDRNFEIGDELLLREYDKDEELHTGRNLRLKITYVLQGEEAEGFGLKAGFCIMGLEKIIDSAQKRA